MHNSNFMNVLNPRNKLMEHTSCFRLRNSLILDDVVKKLTPLHKLHDKKELLGSLYNFVQLDYVWMPDQF